MCLSKIRDQKTPNQFKKINILKESMFYFFFYNAFQLFILRIQPSYKLQSTFLLLVHCFSFFFFFVPPMFPIFQPKREERGEGGERGRGGEREGEGERETERETEREGEGKEEREREDKIEKKERKKERRQICLLIFKLLRFKNSSKFKRTYLSELFVL